MRAELAASVGLAEPGERPALDELVARFDSDRLRRWPREMRVRTLAARGICAAGVVIDRRQRDETGLEGGGVLIAAGISVWLLNWFYRVGVRGRARPRREDARATSSTPTATGPTSARPRPSEATGAAGPAPPRPAGDAGAHRARGGGGRRRP